MPILRKAWTTYRKGREYVSSLEEHGNSWALSAVDALESRNQRKTRALIAAGGIVATIGMWLAHWFYPYVLDHLIQLQSKILFLFVFAVVIAPPFAAAFSIFSIIFPRPMSRLRPTLNRCQDTYTGSGRMPNGRSYLLLH